MDNYTLEQEKVNRINTLLDRLQRISIELDRVHEKLHTELSRQEFTELVDERSNLMKEQVLKEQELKETYQRR
ncbi:hypothetical protein HMPREF1214_04159 [Bacteroides sp. HPS0048]|uniref:hypothetical protein n=1 Tax=Bacteroides sp. HPS0048 TaxID=1078089 RepID=UPI0003787AF6|nr:hypothetical protein [Bacteroides sp. HPS0048]EOA54333.1 hypothetical protein HMPREF1214_04159 [Bacteroides sp. HPS0048]